MLVSNVQMAAVKEMNELRFSLPLNESRGVFLRLGARVLDTRVTPGRILSRHADDQVDNRMLSTCWFSALRPNACAFRANCRTSETSI